MYAANRLYDFIGVSDISEETPDLSYVAAQNVPDLLLSDLKQALCLELSPMEEDKFYCGVMSILTPAPSQIEGIFWKIYDTDGAQKACDFLHDLSIKNYYMKKTAIDKNKLWRVDFGNKYLEITINLSKPEKSNADIAKLLTAKSTGYPKCALCYENLGYNGGDAKSPRQNIRFIPLEINGEDWFFQYSPYAYYDEHCIVISRIHRPMCIDRSTYRKLYDFVKRFPNYFLGSNASLPIVGGSILNHEHFQGGLHKLPVCNAPVKREYRSKTYKDVSVYTLDWYNSCIRLVSDNAEELLSLSGDITEKWMNYSDASCGIYSETEGVMHNSITPVMYYNAEGKLTVEMILRNNIETEEYPDGVFHAHKQYHNIKKEGIGIIEAMGMFILPGRLLNQSEKMAEFLTGEKYDVEALRGTDMEVHISAIKALLDKYGNALSKTDADKAVKEYINETCRSILINTACFKDDENGRVGFERFILANGMEEI